MKPTRPETSPREAVQLATITLFCLAVLQGAKMLGAACGLLHP